MSLVLTADEQKVIKQIKSLINSTTSRYEHAQQAGGLLADLEDSLVNRGFEVNRNTQIISASDITKLRRGQLKNQLNTNNDYEPSTLQDLAFIDRHPDEHYFYIDGYNRVELLTNDDVQCTLDDLLNY